MPNTVSTFVTDVVNITPTAFTFKRKAICFLDDRGTQVNGLKNTPLPRKGIRKPGNQSDRQAC